MTVIPPIPPILPIPPIPILCAVTDRRRFPEQAGGLQALVAQVAAARDAGVDWIQIREPDLPAARLYELVKACVDTTRGSTARIIVNERVDVALAAGAHGVHLRGSSVDAARVRDVAGERFLIGRSVHAIGEARDVEAAGGLDYLIFGTIFPTVSKPADHPLAGLEALRAVAAACRLPVLAIGGITLENAPRIAGTGAAGIAAIGLFQHPEAHTVAAVRRSFAAAG